MVWKKPTTGKAIFTKDSSKIICYNSFIHVYDINGHELFSQALENEFQEGFLISQDILFFSSNGAFTLFNIDTFEFTRLKFKYTTIDTVLTFRDSLVIFGEINKTQKWNRYEKLKDFPYFKLYDAELFTFSLKSYFTKMKPLQKAVINNSHTMIAHLTSNIALLDINFNVISTIDIKDKVENMVFIKDKLYVYTLDAIYSIGTKQHDPIYSVGTKQHDPIYSIRTKQHKIPIPKQTKSTSSSKIYFLNETTISCFFVIDHIELYNYYLQTNIPKAIELATEHSMDLDEIYKHEIITKNVEKFDLIKDKKWVLDHCLGNNNTWLLDTIKIHRLLKIALKVTDSLTSGQVLAELELIEHDIKDEIGHATKDAVEYDLKNEIGHATKDGLHDKSVDMFVYRRRILDAFDLLNTFEYIYPNTGVIY
jgi:hypothetical protein